MSKTAEEYSKQFDEMYGDHIPDLPVSKAEQAALKTYPHFTAENLDEVIKVRKFFAKGYTQAEKDLALTWEDIERIEHYCEQVNREHNMGTFRGTPYGKSFYKEVARRFNKAKEEKKWIGI